MRVGGNVLVESARSLSVFIYGFTLYVLRYLNSHNPFLNGVFSLSLFLRFIQAVFVTDPL